MCLKRLRLNKKIILKKTWYIVSGLYTVLGFISMFVSFDWFSEKLWWCALGYSFLIFLVLFSIVFLVVSVWVFNIKEICVFVSDAGKKVYVRFGDIFDFEKEKYHIVIPVNRCFDTIVDDDLISNNSLHGVFLSKLYKSKDYTPETLNEKIQNNLSSKLDESVEQICKRKGNLFRYQVGTIVEIEKREFLKYFLLGLSEFGEDLSASVTKEDFALALQRLIDYSNKRSQGYPIVLPLIGSGLSKLDLSKQTILD